MQKSLSIKFLFLCAGVVSALWGCDAVLTKAPLGPDTLESPFSGLTNTLNTTFVRGDENFDHVFTVREGLGPIFNQPACASCHPGDGRGKPDAGLLVRFSRGSDLIPLLGGPQLQDRAIPGVMPETLPPGVNTSPRLPPPVFGVGLIEAIPEETILKLADPDDIDGDGISGRPNMVEPAEFVPPTEVGSGPGPRLGRFSRKAQVTSLLQQISEAYHQDMGITSDFLPVENPHPQAGGAVAPGDQVPDPEITARVVLETVAYVRLLAPPRRGEITEEVRKGEALFASLGCAKCHVPSLRTGPSPVPQLNSAEARLYSDLLLHDMGPALADNRPDGQANGLEWRTTPLWGLRLVAENLGGTPFYLHDGRTSDLSEAIRLHGGEAEKARNAFVGLSDADRRAVIAFLNSL